MREVEASLGRKDYEMNEKELEIEQLRYTSDARIMKRSHRVAAVKRDARGVACM